jgi:DNA-binding transcriptional regulator YdaS (Cro superfamily)
MRRAGLEIALKAYPGGRAAFVRDAGISEGRLSQIIGGENPSPELAKRIHQLTNGEVPASELRPDLWRNSADVPFREEAAE